MQKTILLADRPVTFTLKRFKRSKSVRFSVSSERALLVTAPKWVPYYFIEKTMRSRTDWILGTIAKMPAKASISRGGYKKYKEAARALVEERLNYWNRFYGFSYGRVSIRDQKTRWGSCSKKGNLNFSWKLAVLPAHLSDYVVVHELCHLKEFNHSPKFWALVEQTVPDHKKYRSELHGQALS